MRRFMLLQALATSLLLATGTATAADGIRPDDRAWRGVGPVPASSPIRPDDRAWRGVGPVPTFEVLESPSTRADGFDWTDAGIGAAAMAGLALLAVGGSALVRRHRVAAFS